MYIPISLVIILSRNPPPSGEPGTAFTIKLPKPTAVEAEEKQVLMDTNFMQMGSYLIWGVRPVLDNLLKDHKKELTKYNRLLGRHKIPFRIRLTHTTTVRERKYVYCGRYVYKKNGDFWGKLDDAVFRNELKEDWDKVGGPPHNPLDGLSYRIFSANGKETDCVIVPYNLYHNGNFHHIFANYTAIRLGGE